MKLGGIEQNVETGRVMERDNWGASYCYCYADLVMIQHWFGPHSFFHHFFYWCFNCTYSSIDKEAFWKQNTAGKVWHIEVCCEQKGDKWIHKLYMWWSGETCYPCRGDSRREREKWWTGNIVYFILILPDLTYWLTNLLSFLSLLKSDNEYF